MARHLRPRPRPVAALLGVGVLGLGLGLASCGSSTTGGDTSTVPEVLPAAQALPGTGGTWATLAMGQFGQPLNTFGELFYRPSCATSCSAGRWSLVTPPGVASNGGIMVAANPDGGVTAGFGVSLGLKFSPLAETSDAGAVWSGGILPVGLAAVPDSLAASGTSRHLALAATGPSGVGGVLSAGSDITTWSREASLAAVATAASRSGCSLGKETAVAIAGTGDDLVAGDCTGGDRAGIFRVGTNGTSTPVVAAGPTIPSTRGGEIRVERLVATASGLSALVSTGAGTGSRLYLATSDDDAVSWSVSSSLSTDRPVVSASVTATGGFVVQLGGAGGGGAAVVTSGAPWRTLAAPPVGTAVIASVSDDGSLESLVPTGSVLDVYLLGPGGWNRVQALGVPIQYGSSG